MEIKDYLNKIICGDALEELKKMPDESVDMVCTSPPYWALRNYETESRLWDGDVKCKHEWTPLQKTLRHKAGETNPGKEGWYKDKGASDDKGSNFCSLCGAWRGSLGLEPSFELYIKHLCDIFDEVKRVLKKTGTCFVNIGDTYSGSGGAGGDYNPGGIREGQPKYKAEKQNLLAKSLCQIPSRFAIEMSNRGWILRNEIIWYKRNCMPSSAKDRFTVDFEKIFFFVKNKNYWFETQYEPVQECSIKRLYRAVSNRNKWLNGADGQTKHTMNQPRPNRNYKRYEKSNAPHEFEGSDHLLSPFDPEIGRNKRCVWLENEQYMKLRNNLTEEQKLCVFQRLLSEGLI